MTISLFIAGLIGSFTIVCCIAYLMLLDSIDNKYKSY